MDYLKLTKKELLEKIEELEHEVQSLNDYVTELEMSDSVLELRKYKVELTDELENDMCNFLHSLRVGEHEGVDIDKLEEYYENYRRFN